MLAIKQFMAVFFEERRTSSTIMWATYIFYFVLAGVERFVFNTMPSHLLFVVPLLFVITLNYKSSVLKRIAATLSNYAVFTVAVLFVYLPVSQLVSHEYLFILEYSIGSLLALFITFFMRRFNAIKKGDKSTLLFWALTFTMPSTVIIILLLETFGHRNASWLLSFVFLMGANLFIFFVYENLASLYEVKQKQALDAQEKAYYYTQCKLMQDSVDAMKSYRHDVKNHLAVLKNFTPGNAAATDYLNSLLGSIGESEVYSETGNTAFDSIINYKLKDASKHNIDLQIKIFVPPELNIETSDVVTIFGNLLDNAFDAAARVEEKMIRLRVEATKGNLFIKIDNTFDGIVNYTDGTIIATRKDKDKHNSHGYGLKNIRKAVEKYDGHMDISHEGTVFSVGILLYLEDFEPSYTPMSRNIHLAKR
jgi:signal transduction histidine kinase